MKIEVEIISKQFIKPSSPTPHHLRHYQLSSIDQFQELSLPFLFFYPENPSTSSLEKINLVKKSVSQVLTTFYPLAGRVKGNSFVDCNDEGFLFVEAKANCDLFLVLRDRNPNDINIFVPLKPDEAGDLAASSQITFFNCGGLAISFAMAHKLGDGFSMLSFLSSWSAVASGDIDITVPTFGWAALFPPVNPSSYQPKTLIPISKKKTVTKVFVFDFSIVEALKAKYTVNGERPSKVEALAAFIWSRFMATTQAEAAKNKQYLVTQTVNLRSRTGRPMPKLSFGNLSWMAVAEADMEAKDDETYGIVKRMKDSIRIINADYVKKFLKKMAETFGKEEVVSFNFTSLCNFPAYEIDFGWGKALWFATIPLISENLVYFSDTRKGQGIEAWISLKEEDMAKFEIDSPLLAHVSSSSPPLLPQSRL